MYIKALLNRLARHREYDRCRHAAMTPEQHQQQKESRQALKEQSGRNDALGRRRESYGLRWEMETEEERQSKLTANSVKSLIWIKNFPGLAWHILVVHMYKIHSKYCTPYFLLLSTCWSCWQLTLLFSGIFVFQGSMNGQYSSCWIPVKRHLAYFWIVLWWWGSSNLPQDVRHWQQSYYNNSGLPQHAFSVCLVFMDYQVMYIQYHIAEKKSWFGL